MHSALLSLAATAGAQLTINMQRWSAEAKQLNLSHILAHHHKTAVQLAEQRKASCSVDPEQPADTQGKCKNGGTTDAAGGGGGADCSGNSCDASCDSSSSSSSTGGSSHSSSSSRKTGCKGSCTNVLGMASSVVNSQFGGSTSSSGTEDSEGSIIDEVGLHKTAMCPQLYRHAVHVHRTWLFVAACKAIEHEKCSCWAVSALCFPV